MKKTITVFGSSLPKQGEIEYDTAYQIGIELAKYNFNVCSGGFAGIMEAVSKGAVENGSEAIGVTIDLWKGTPNKYLTKVIHTETLLERLTKLIEIGDGFLILNGGTGTLLEVAAVWEFMNKSLTAEKPAACFGEMWEPVICAIEKRVKFEGRKENLIFFNTSINECLNYLKLKIND